MRRCSAIVFASLLLMPAALSAQEELSSDQLRRMYDDALAQMRTAQDRRNELARENEKLRARIAQLEKELQMAQSQVTDISDGTFRARAEHAAINDFLDANPLIKRDWLAFLHQNLLASPDLRSMLDADWPFYAIR